MSDLHEMAEGHRQSFARVVSRWADGEPMEFRVRPGAIDYGSTNTWHKMDNPWFDHNFDYRIASEIEKLNIMAAMHEGYDD